MRKILLASTALVLASASGVAMADDSSSVSVTATVSASCSMTDPEDVTFGADPEIGATDSASFDFTCNFEGDGGEEAGLTVTIVSTNLGLKNLADAEVRDYTVNYNGLGEVLASALVPIADTSTGAGDANSRSFEVKLAEALPVAGAYDDTLTINLAP